MSGPEPSLLRSLDNWAAAHPWHPRVLPFFVYIVCLALMGFADSIDPRLYPALYVIQCTAVTWLLVRHRKLLPEMTLTFHWLAVPVGVGVFVAWVALGWWMAGEFPERWDALLHGRYIAMKDYPDDAVPRFATDDSRYDTFFETMGPTLGWTTLALRLLGMSLLVPVFEELFIRSLMLRSLSDRRKTWLGLKQVLCDVPIIGESFIHTKAGADASRQNPVFGEQFESTPLGKLTVFGVVASTFVFMLSHVPRDWPGIWACGVAYCLLVGATGRRKGLGPVIWAHGITNALLWVYTVHTGDWQFL